MLPHKPLDIRVNIDVGCTMSDVNYLVRSYLLFKTLFCLIKKPDVIHKRGLLNLERAIAEGSKHHSDFR
jgi:hypothetical protein